ncbi:hypothetical protein OGAPHI_003791 [Ogataea philodendri]|uniref:Metal resistance protein YCF1 n=1 Tax=Ogataea philodendri TaxID=1378263 RepID=A0A9P8P4E0_9ASCO|nr:uncharacterized protein OGAPHI_003791 [Ogataea philodendri]KAH3665603.1 hypothetical protein OGAPHI_003791 [Ogataea philodendri]
MSEYIINGLEYDPAHGSFMEHASSFWVQLASGFANSRISAESINQTSSFCGCLDGEGFSPVSALQDPTPCFVNGVLGTTLSAFLLIGGLHDITRLRNKKNISSKAEWWFILKLVLVAVQVVFQLLLTVLIWNSSLAPKSDVIVWSSVLQLFALTVAFGLSYIENYKSYISSAYLITYYIFDLVVGSLKVTNVFLRDSKSLQAPLVTLALFNSLFLLLLEINFSPKEKKDPNKNDNLYDGSNIFAKVTFTWLTPLMQKGSKKFLTQRDLPQLPSFLRSNHLAGVLDDKWDKQLHRKSPSLTWAIASSFGGPFFISCLFKIVQDICAFIQPQLLKQLIRFVNLYQEDTTTPLTRGFMLVAMMFLVSVVQTASLHQYFTRVFDTGIKVRSSLTSLIYKKSLVLSVEAKQKKSTGDIVNLMSVDTQRLQDLCQSLNIIWSGPLQIILCLVSLYNLLGNAMWLGVFFLAVSVPLNTWVFRQQKKLQKTQMKVKDARTGLISEILNNIKSLKLYAWENPYREKLMDVRNNKELENLKKIGVFQACSNFIFNSTPFFVSSSTFALFIISYKGVPLSTDIVFTALSLFNLLGFPLAVLPWTIGNIIEAQVAITRITDFLKSDELDDFTIDRRPAVTEIGQEVVKIDNADFLWSKEPYKLALSNITYSAKKGDLNCILGRVGAGKSAILQSLLGDLHKPTGSVTVHGSVAYVPQVAWIMNGTIKENILFGCKFDAEFYDKTIKACALTHDLNVLPDGDSTQVGEKGISLSGGQKARLSLARAVYARADLYLLDDILSAVDEHVGKHLINNVLGPEGLLSTKCRILATNNLNVLKSSDSIVLVQEGRIVESGHFDDIVASQNSELYTVINDAGQKKKEEDITETVVDKEATDDSRSESSELDEEIKKLANKELEKAVLEDFRTAVETKDEIVTGREEKHEQGKVKSSIYRAYAKACGIKNVIILLAGIIVSMILSTAGNVWLKHWSDINTEKGYNPTPWKYLGIYFALCIGCSVVLLAQTIIQWLYVSIQGSKYLHQIMLDGVLRAPMQFFETTPVGRVLNRFSPDIYKIDEQLTRVFVMFFANSIKVSIVILVIIYSTWQFVFLVVPLAVLYRFYQLYYLATSRELRRLDSVSKSPIFAHFQETLSGVATVRAYDQLDRFLFLNQHKMDQNMSAYHPSVSANRWLAVRLEFLGSLIILGASGLLVFTLKSGHITPGLVGLSVSYALQVTQSLNWIVRMTVEIETNIVSVERVLEYASLEPEAPPIIENSRPAQNWPFRGTIEFKEYSARYRPELDLVLKNINISVNEKEKIGIVGRTGAGKSSLTLAIFRIIEAANGHIDIDEVNTSNIGLYDLRSKLSIIPQDSQIFEGSLRSNIDPTEMYTDEELWEALELAHLKEHILKMYDDAGDKEEIKENPLLIRISEGGSNLSAGQRQLMCLARALVKKNSRVLILDEATANVDYQTDAIVQETIRSAFKERTILTIAHRLNTIIDSDRIIVLEKGEVAEFDTPANLLKKKDSLFYSLCKEGGLVE